MSSALPRRFTRILLLVALALPAVAAGSLDKAASGFLRAHASDAVNWLPWGAEAFAKAKSLDKPVYVHVGYAGNELARAMQRQSFSNAKVAANLNENFVCVLVDREELPDVAAALQTYIRRERQLSGWPTNVWLTPELQPFDGGGYLPPSEEWGKEGLTNVVQRVTGGWATDRASLRKKAADIAKRLAENSAAGPADANGLTAAADSWRQKVDAANGGFGESPKFPEPEVIRYFLLGPDADRKLALAAIQAVDTGALHDPIDGGFYRYSVDAAWHVPLFQKTSSDQARLVLALLDAARISGDARFAASARTALDFSLQRLLMPNGGFIVSEDATSEEITPQLAWTEAEINQLLGAEAGAAFAKAHGVTAKGNVAEGDDPSQRFVGKNILIAGTITATDWQSSAEGRNKLLKVRDARATPLRNENLLADSQGLMILALATAGQQLKEPKYLDAAKKTAAFLNDAFLDKASGRVKRLAGSSAPASSLDVASLAAGYSALGRATGDKQYAEQAEGLLKKFIADYFDAHAQQVFVGPKETVGLYIRPYALESDAGDPPTALSMAGLAAQALPANSGTRAEAIAVLAPALERVDATGSAPGDQLLAAVLLSKQK